MTDVACGGRDQDSLRDALLRRLRDAQLDGLTGKVLYSGINTLKKGPVYFLGFNPGGDPAKETMTLAEHVTQSPSDWNEYLDAKWGAPGGGWRPPGQAPLQRRVQWLLNQLGLQTREVCASNLIFNRSIDQARLNDWSGVADRRWPIHDWIIKLVQPHAILCKRANRGSQDMPMAPRLARAMRKTSPPGITNFRGLDVDQTIARRRKQSNAI